MKKRCYFPPEGVGYALISGTSAVTVVGVGDLLIQVADNVRRTSTGLSIAFLARALGQLLVVACAPPLYRVAQGNTVLVVTLLIQVVLWLWLPHITSVILLYVWFACAGITNAAVDTGVQIQTRRVYKDRAGPWLTGSTFMFAIMGVLAPLTSYVADGIITQTAVYAGFTCACALVLMPYTISDAWSSMYSPHPKTMPRRKKELTSNGEDGQETDVASLETMSRTARESDIIGSMSNDELVEGTSVIKNEDMLLPNQVKTSTSLEEKDAFKAKEIAEQDEESKGSGLMGCRILLPLLQFLYDLWWGKYTTEMVLMLMIFVGMGVQVATSSFMCTFIEQSDGAVNEGQCSLLLSLFWASMALSRFLAMLSQAKLTTIGLYRNILMVCFLSSIASGPLVYGAATGSYEEWHVWVSVLLWGVVFGPFLGYIFDMSNRVCQRTEEGAAILILGLQLGASVVPLAVGIMWDKGAGPASIPMALSLGMFMVLLIGLYLPKVNPRVTTPMAVRPHTQGPQLPLHMLYSHRRSS